MKKYIAFPCSQEAASMIIGNHGYSGLGHYVKLIQIIQKLPDNVLKKENLQHVINVHGFEPLIIEELLANTALFHEDLTRYAPVEEKVIHKENVDKKVANSILPEHELQKYVQKYFPRVSFLPIQMSVKNCETLLETYDKHLIVETLKSMENCSYLLKKYVNVYLTLNNWCRMSMDRGWKAQSTVRAATA